MARIQEVRERETLAPAERGAWDDIVASRGSIRGPFGVLLHSPELARRAAHLGGYLRYEAGLDPQVRETAVMATAHLVECAYEWAAHAPQARAVGVSEDVLEAIGAGRADDLPEPARDIYRLAEGVLVQHRVPADLFERLEQRLGRRGLVEVVAAIGYWAFVAATLNTFEVLPAHA